MDRSRLQLDGEISDFARGRHGQVIQVMEHQGYYLVDDGPRYANSVQEIFGRFSPCLVVAWGNDASMSFSFFSLENPPASGRRLRSRAMALQV